MIFMANKFECPSDYELSEHTEKATTEYQITL
jgi:hypothetical protein